MLCETLITHLFEAHICFLEERKSQGLIASLSVNQAEYKHTGMCGTKTIQRIAQKNNTSMVKQGGSSVMLWSIFS